MSNDDRLNAFNPCPLCGKKDRLDLTSQEIYAECLSESGSACVGIDCRRCDLSIYTYGTNPIKYDDRVQILKSRWNRLAAVPDSPEEKEQSSHETI